jgi:hypothetical protein
MAVGKLWPHVRAALLLFHVTAVVLAAVPAPEGGMQKSAWKDPTVQGEFDAWYTRARQLGYRGDRTEFEEGLWAFAVRYARTRGDILTPFKPYYKYFGTGQGWRMFVAPHRFPARLTIDVRRNGEWESVYVERSRTEVWLAPILDHDRLRSATFRYSWPQYGKTYGQFCAWIQKRARVDFPDADRLRVRYFKFRSRSPEEVRANEPEDGKWILTRELPLTEKTP